MQHVEAAVNVHNTIFWFRFAQISTELTDATCCVHELDLGYFDAISVFIVAL
jgi:hypothetical protein